MFTIGEYPLITVVPPSRFNTLWQVLVRCNHLINGQHVHYWRLVSKETQKNFRSSWTSILFCCVSHDCPLFHTGLSEVEADHPGCVSSECELSSGCHVSLHCLCHHPHWGRPHRDQLYCSRGSRHHHVSIYGCMWVISACEYM